MSHSVHHHHDSSHEELSHHNHGHNEHHESDRSLFLKKVKKNFKKELMSSFGFLYFIVRLCAAALLGISLFFKEYISQFAFITKAFGHYFAILFVIFAGMYLTLIPEWVVMVMGLAALLSTKETIFEFKGLLGIIIVTSVASFFSLILI